VRTAKVRDLQVIATSGLEQQVRTTAVMKMSKEQVIVDSCSGQQQFMKIKRANNRRQLLRKTAVRITAVPGDILGQQLLWPLQANATAV